MKQPVAAYYCPGNRETCQQSAAQLNPLQAVRPGLALFSALVSDNVCVSPREAGTYLPELDRAGRIVPQSTG